VGLGLGGRRYQVVFLVEDKKAFDKFVNKGWQADTSANATACAGTSDHDQRDTRLSSPKGRTVETRENDERFR
jgi:hypothetical protein